MGLLNCTPYKTYIASAVGAEGCWITDENGRKYLDFEAGVWCASLGHGNRAVNEALCEQLNAVAHVGYGYFHQVAERAASALLDILGLKNGQCLFLSSGSEAVEFSVQAVRQIMPRPCFLSLNGYYLSAYGLSKNRDDGRWFSLDLPQDAEESDFEKILQNVPFDRIGAFVFEPGNASGTVRLPPSGLISLIADKIKKHKGFLVVDEVTTGMGRTGRWFGFEHYGLKPDVVVCGKGLGNGYPVSAVGVSEEVAEKLGKTDFRYAQSHQNDPLACAVAETVIETMKREGLVARAAETGAYFLKALEALAAKHDCVREARGRGLMCVLQLADRERYSVVEAQRRLIEAGFIAGINPGAGVLRFYAPLIVEKSMIDALTEALDGIFSRW